MTERCIRWSRSLSKLGGDRGAIVVAKVVHVDDMQVDTRLATAGVAGANRIPTRPPCRLRQLSGSPVLTCVKPRAQWTGTPSGHVRQRLMTRSSTVTANQWTPTSAADLSANDYVTVPFLSGAVMLRLHYRRPVW